MHAPANPSIDFPLVSGSLFDLSHTIEHGMITYRGLPGPLICDFLSREASRQHYAEGTEFHDGD
jgi:arylformamidase